MAGCWGLLAAMVAVVCCRGCCGAGGRGCWEGAGGVEVPDLVLLDVTLDLTLACEAVGGIGDVVPPPAAPAAAMPTAAMLPVGGTGLTLGLDCRLLPAEEM